MGQSSIFEGVVRGEDSYTNLLRNLMSADEAYGMAISALLRPEAFATHFVALPDLRTQVLLTSSKLTHGRADLLIETESAVLLVEVKIDLYCGLTENQDFCLDDSGEPKLKGYLQYLEHRRLKGHDVGLCLLVPRSWQHRGATERQLKELVSREIPAQLRTWEEVCRLTMESQFGELVHQFGAFLERDFMDISFTAQEISLLTSGAGLTAFGSASLKLHELVKQARKELKVHLDKRGEARFEIKELWSDGRECGAAVHCGDKRVLWFGTWAEANWPLVVGFEERLAPSDQLDFSGLSPVVKPIAKWKVFCLPQECFTGHEPLRNFVLALLRIFGGARQ